MPDVTLRKAKLELLRNDLTVCLHAADKLGLSDAVSLIGMAVLSVLSEIPKHKNDNMDEPQRGVQ